MTLQTVLSTAKALTVGVQAPTNYMKCFELNVHTTLLGWTIVAQENIAGAEVFEETNMGLLAGFAQGAGFPMFGCAAALETSHSLGFAYEETVWAVVVTGSVAAGTRLGRKAGDGMRRFGCYTVEDYTYNSTHAVDFATAFVQIAVDCMLPA